MYEKDQHYGGANAPPPQSSMVFPPQPTTGYPPQPTTGYSPQTTISVPPPQLTMTTIGGVTFVPARDSYHLMLKDETKGVENCCAPGGCCVDMPSRKLFNPQGEMVRVNIPYAIMECCGPGKGVMPKDSMVPPELAARGLTQQQWEYWTGQLWEAQKYRSGCCCCCCHLLCCICLPCFTPCFCQKKREEVENWSRELFNWQNRFNADVGRLGIFVKTRSICRVYYDKDGKKRDVTRWLSFSFEPRDIHMLQSEPHLSGDIESGCCGGPSERECPMHP